MPTALVAEDNPQYQEMYNLILPGLGYEITFTDNGADAVARCSEAANPFDLIMLDMQMPRLNGLAALDQIRLDARYRDTHVVIITANAHMIPDRDDPYCFVFMKPIDLSRLMHFLGRIKEHQTH